MSFIEYVKFVLDCILFMLDYAVGGSANTPNEKAKAIHGTIGFLLAVVCFWLMIKFICIDHEGYPKKNGVIVFAIGCSIAVLLSYLAFVFLIQK